MLNYFKIFFEENVLLKTFVIIGIVQVIFFAITYDNYFFSDDYQYLIGLKLYNLIQGQTLSLDNLLNLLSNHFVPVYLFFHQYMPDNYIYYHGIVAFFLFLSSMTVFMIVLKLTNSNKISFLSAFLYSINMSIHIRPYVWNIFDYSIINSFTGFLSILFFILYFQSSNYKKYIWLISYFFFSILSCLNFENGLIYPVIAALIGFLFLKKNFLSKIFIGLVPIAFFFILVILSGKSPYYLAEERLDHSYNQRLEKKLEINSNTYAFFYRSQYAYRNLPGYSFRVFDNLSSSINLYSLESSAKYFVNSDNLKKYVINNYLKLIFVLFLALFVLVTIFIKNLKQIKFQYPITKFLSIYGVTFCIYTFLFHRQDINTALAFSSAVLIAIIVIEFYKNKLFFIPSLVLSFFIGSTILYSATGFEHVKYQETRSGIKNISKIHYQNAKNKIWDENLKYFLDYKFLYFYINYNDHKDYLKKYKKMQYSEFLSAIILEKRSYKN